MGAIVSLATGRRFTLSSRCILGRHPRCDVRVDHVRISGEHAAVHWSGAAWELRDLGSRNGTLIAGKPLLAGVRATLSAGGTFALADPELTFRLDDASPPAARARSASGVVREAGRGPLVLPSDDDPAVSLFEDASGAWTAETPEKTHLVSDGDTITVGGQIWTLELPALLASTWHAGEVSPTLETTTLRLSVSRNEEHVDVTVLHEGKETRLPPRNHHYVLVVLARALLGDSDPSPGERGWIEREQLCRMLGVDSNTLGVHVYRIRKQLAEAGVLGAADIIARRPATGELRLGTHRVEVVPV